MKKYTVYFEFFGRKMKTTVLALSEQQAKDMVKLKINFIKVEEQKPLFPKGFGEVFGDIFK